MRSVVSISFAACLLGGCASAPPSPAVYDVAPEDWTVGFADLPADGDLSIYELDSGVRPLPPGLEGTGVLVQGQVEQCIQRVLLLLLGQIRNGMDASQFHGFVDGSGAHIQGAPEDKRETQHVVDLIGIVRAPGGNDAVRPHGLGLLRQNLRDWIG